MRAHIHISIYVTVRVAKASVTEEVGWGFKPRPDHYNST